MNEIIAVKSLLSATTGKRITARLRQAILRLVNYDIFGADVGDMGASRSTSSVLVSDRGSAADTGPATDRGPLAPHTGSAAHTGSVTPHAAPAALPNETELYRLYELYNLLYFEGRLPKARIAYSARMLAAGSCDTRSREIRIGTRYHQLFPDEISDTLKHEMIHLLYRGHGRDFVSMARALGVSIRARSHPSLRRPAKYLYRCTACGADYPRQKRVRMASCGVCTAGRTFDARFKLKLVSS